MATMGGSDSGTSLSMTVFIQVLLHCLEDGVAIVMRWLVCLVVLLNSYIYISDGRHLMSTFCVHSCITENTHTDTH